MIPKNEDKSSAHNDLNMVCTKFGEDWMKNVPKAAKNVFLKKFKMAEKFLGTNGSGIYQSTWYHPRNTLCKNGTVYQSIARL